MNTEKEETTQKREKAQRMQNPFVYFYTLENIYNTVISDLGSRSGNINTCTRKKGERPERTHGTGVYLTRSAHK
jgi:hypothetical protein